MNILTKLNVQPDPQDPRDYLFQWDATAIRPLSHDLRSYCAEMEDQKSIGSCTANATASNCEMFLKAGGKYVDVSRLFNYFTSRSYLSLENQNNDEGSNERVALKAARNFGIARETIWPYDVTQWNTKPSDAAYVDALDFKAEGYYRIPLVNSAAPTIAIPVIQVVEYAIAKGFPVLLGAQVGETLRALQPGQIYSYLNPTTNPLIGGHQVLIVGYTPDYFIVENSWGVDWCDRGFFFMRKEIVITDVIDIWVLMGFAGVERIGTDATAGISGDTATFNCPKDAVDLSHYNLTNVKRFQFSDTRIAMDTDGNPNAGADLAGPANAGQVYRLYRAALNRAPDQIGLSYWIGQADAAIPLVTIAAGFTGSTEFRTAYGAPTDHQFVDLLYQNVLHRVGDAEGTAYWYAQLDSRAQTREQVLVGFSESLENQAAVAFATKNGIAY